LTGVRSPVQSRPPRLDGLIAASGEQVARAGVTLLRCSRHRVGLALVYHRVALRTGDPLRELVPAHGVALLERQLAHLGGSYRLVGAAELPDAVRRRRCGQRFPVAVTFDDDGCTHAAHAAPVLRRLGAPATFFLSGGHLDPPFRYWWDEGSEPAMTAADIRSLAADGFAVGFHTLGHAELLQLDEAALSAAMTDGRDRIAALSGQALSAIAYPHGRADARVARAAHRAGYAVGFSGATVAVTGGCDPLLLGRIEPSRHSAGHLALRLLVTLGRSVFASTARSGL
jgi:peptidoglycan/xylan/chitin deacetylase (PgdA/CDA1 family)